MRDKIKGFVIGILLCVFIFGGTVYAAGGSMIEVFFNVKDIKIDHVSKMPTDNKPFIYNGSTCVPLRFIAENLGEDVKWDGKTGTVIIGESEGESEVFLGNGIEYMNHQEGNSNHTGSYVYNSNEKIVDNLGNEYSNYFYQTIEDLNGFYTIEPKDAWAYFEFPLNGQYKTFVATAGLTKEYQNTNSTITLTISVDEEVRYTTSFKAGDFLKDINVDVEGANKIQIKTSTDSEGDAQLGLFNPRFIKK
ncbi:MAG: stalk domain-containing protein [Paenibacillaceae bacterium]